MGSSEDETRGRPGDSSSELELRLEPPETSILRPTRAELEAALSGLLGRPWRARGPMELAAGETAAEATRVSLEGTPDAIEAIRVSLAAGGGPAEDPRRPWAELARSLNWRLYDPRSRRWLRPQDVLTPAPQWRRTLEVARPGLMGLAAGVVVAAVAAWHLGGRRQGAWLVVVAAGAAVYFSLRAWGLLTRPRRGR